LPPKGGGKKQELPSEAKFGREWCTGKLVIKKKREKEAIGPVKWVGGEEKKMESHECHREGEGNVLKDGERESITWTQEKLFLKKTKEAENRGSWK